MKLQFSKKGLFQNPVVSLVSNFEPRGSIDQVFSSSLLFDLYDLGSPIGNDHLVGKTPVANEAKSRLKTETMLSLG